MYNDFFKKMRKESKLNQTDFAKLLGIPQVTYSNYECGRVMPSCHVLLKLAAKGVRFELIFSEEIALMKQLEEARKSRDESKEA